MKRIFALVILLSLAIGIFVQAEGPDAHYVKIYNLIAEGDQAGSTGQLDAARLKYGQAEAELRKLQSSHPNWNEKVVQFRLEYIAEKLKATGGRALAPAARDRVSIPPTAPQGDDKDRQIQSLGQEVQQLKQEKSILEAKLKEALSSQPAAIDPRELAKAEERIKLLEKEKELLKVSLAQEQGKQSKQQESPLVEDLRKALADATKKVNEQSARLVQIEREKEILEARLQSAQRVAESAPPPRTSVEQTPKPIAERKPSAEPSAREIQAQKEPVTSRSTDNEVNRLQTALKSLQMEKAALETAKKELETKLASLSAPGGARAGTEGDRLKQVEKERDDLLKKLNETSRQLYDNKARSETVRKEQFDSELAILRARIEVFEARKVPYTPEELALFKEPNLAASKTDPKAGKKSVKELPRGAAPLVAEAERAFAAKRFDDAEKKYVEALRLDEKNAFTLANLAACQLEQSRLDEAESNLKKALQSEPNEPHALSLLGILKFRQEKFDEALDLLSRSAQSDPQNPETQNYLGITLSQKGQRGPAESALRKAIQLSPGYGGAQHNLAVIYATQQPPFVELARWHYQKALASGHQQNPELEKIIEGKGATTETK